MLIKESNSPIDRKISRFLEAQKSSEAMLVIAPPTQSGDIYFLQGMCFTVGNQEKDERKTGLFRVSDTFPHLVFPPK